MIRADNACRPDRLDPASLPTLSGLEIVNGLADGRLPRLPIAEMLPFTLYPPSAVRVEDDGGRLYAHGTSSCLIVSIAAQARDP